MIELILFFGVLLAFGLWELRKMKKMRLEREKREREEAEASNSGSEKDGSG